MTTECHIVGGTGKSKETPFILKKCGQRSSAFPDSSTR